MTRGGVKRVLPIRVVPVKKKKKIYHCSDRFIIVLINVLVRYAEGNLFIPSSGLVSSRSPGGGRPAVSEKVRGQTGSLSL